MNNVCDVAVEEGQSRKALGISGTTSDITGPDPVYLMPQAVFTRPHLLI